MTAFLQVLRHGNSETKPAGALAGAAGPLSGGGGGLVHRDYYRDDGNIRLIQ
jgi:hypothetical protein